MMRVLTLLSAAVWVVSVAVMATPQQKSADPPVDAALVKALIDEGSTLFATDCAACHAAEGDTVGVGPSMTNNAALASKDHVLTRILEGMPAKGMPPFATTYTDRKIAAVATFIRGSFENAYSAVVEEDVKRVREELKKKK